MKVLVVGSGGREHALAWALARSPQVSALHIAPGNGGTQALGRNVAIGAEDVPALTAYAREQRVDLVVIGPEAPLAAGLADALGAEGLRVFGPRAAAARIEASKADAKAFMQRHGIPTAEHATFDDYGTALDYLHTHPAPIVLKANGLAAGKGVFVCRSDAEARSALELIMRRRAFGAAGDRVVIEEHLTGQEVTVLAFCDGCTVAPMIVAQDHKALQDGDRGPNTGGMGSYAPAPLLSAAQWRQVRDAVLLPTVDGLRHNGTPYVGVLYAGLMIAPDGAIRVLEFNCRFGDPEAQAILPLLETDLAEVALACTEGTLGQVALRWREEACVCVVIASQGYPGSYERGHPIEGLEEAAAAPQSMVFHAGTRREGERVVTDGGRVLGVTAWDVDLAGAVSRAYNLVERIHWPGAFYRRDIGAKGLAADRGAER